ncbi:MAG: hypothetical protein ACYCUD_12605 [Candidatus Dormibacteria bacterium]
MTFTLALAAHVLLVPRHHYGRYPGRRTARTVRRAGCCGLEALTCCLLVVAAATTLVAVLVLVV